MTNPVYLLSAALLFAGCSSSAQEPTNAAVVVRAGSELASGFVDLPPADPPALDGAPVRPAPSAEYRPPELPRQPPVLQKVSRLACELDIDRTSGGIRITPVVRANTSTSGEYLLVITRTGRGGSSDISQGGAFDAARGERVRLGSSELSMERGSKFHAVLKVRANGREVCRDIRS